MTALRKTKTLSLRMTAEDMNLIARAAKAANKSVSAFVSEVSRLRAQDTLLDQRFFTLDEQDFSWLKGQLGNPPGPAREVLNRFKNVKQKWAKQDGA
ncbi:DUF1778 domain-containing protein [Candidatus Tokpelaia sp.]|uniref:type II toxin-antitoxin system TacA family antitoxin n=1 Tax=Candidatus Tokpelaia sp. TaxID=2233777 RepID=UPI001239A808|nr:DUF1778 domain-containing protein [Candidatus Tokpelaia sp.]KAA6404642.1 toxin-antitoxin system protein [Candidatus Tokpelaia sp.]